jgi:hypothetical protein
MRSVELAVFADALAAEAAALNARLERARGRLRRAAIEREAREALPGEVADRLRRLGLLGTEDTVEAAELEATRLDIVAVEWLQSWIEAQLATASGGGAAARTTPGRAGPPPEVDSGLEPSRGLGEAA